MKVFVVERVFLQFFFINSRLSFLLDAFLTLEIGKTAFLVCVCEFEALNCSVCEASYLSDEIFFFGALPSCVRRRNVPAAFAISHFLPRHRHTVQSNAVRVNKCEHKRAKHEKNIKYQLLCVQINIWHLISWLSFSRAQGVRLAMECDN